jgi:uncharacterized 2Fe-2S/4Fe-4S cluster protein (DUF4445 family)
MKFGVAIDLGTTNIAASLIGLSDKKVLIEKSRINPEISYGTDVLSRVKAIIDKKESLKEMQKMVIEEINDIIEEFISLINISSDDIIKLSISGNPVMEHIVIGFSPISIGIAPYRPLFFDPKILSPDEIGVNINKDGKVIIMPIISGFLGGDTVGLILATGIHKDRDISLALDIGTNCEIILRSKDKIFATSAPAGPALEGFGIKNGMRWEDGAIERVEIKDSEVIINVKGDISPKGICGTGIIDIVAELFKNEVIEPSGRIKNREEIYNNLYLRIIENDTDNEFIIYRDKNITITVSQSDVRMVQLAKGAIWAGIEILKRACSLDDKAINRLFIAGLFGENIRKESLKNIGLIPEELCEKILFVGNTSLKGAQLVIISNELLREVEYISKNIEYIELSGNKEFEELFIKGINMEA